METRQVGKVTVSLSGDRGATVYVWQQRVNVAGSGQRTIYRAIGPGFNVQDRTLRGATVKALDKLADRISP